MSDKKTRDRRSKDFKREFLNSFENDDEDRTFAQYCDENNIKAHTARNWYKQLNIEATKKFLKGLGVDDEGMLNGDIDVFAEEEEEGDQISGSINGKNNNNKSDKDTIDSDELSSQSSTIVGTINTKFKNEMNEQDQSKKEEGIKNNRNEEDILNLFNNKEGDQIQLNQSNKLSKEELIKTNWIISNHLLDICAKYNSKDSNVMLLLHANGIVLLFAYVNIWVWVFFVFFVLLKI